MLASPLSAKIQLGTYALEMLSSTKGTRLYTFGVMIRNDLVSLWYFDSSGVVRTGDKDGKSIERLSLINDFEYVAAILIALAYCNEERFGVMPKSVLSPPQNYVFPPSSLTGFTIDIPTDNDKEDNNTSRQHVTLGGHLYTQYALIGRRTVVYEGTTPASAHKKVVIKMSQQYCNRKSEVVFIEAAREKGIDHVPAILSSKDLWRMSDEGTIRAAFGKHDYEDRVLRCIIMPSYTPLVEQLAQDPDSLKVMVIQLIKCMCCALSVHRCNI
jgi:hypothetical protein